MKKVKSIFLATILSGSALSMQSCLDDNDYAPNFIELGTVVSTSNDGTTEPVVDGDLYGESYITNKSVLKSAEADTEGQRIMYRFTESQFHQPAEDGQKKQSIRIFEIYKVLTKPMDVRTEGEEDVYGNDPINIIYAYNSPKHLNIQYQMLTYSIDIKHRISLVGTPETTPDADGYIDVEFRHNADGDKTSNLVWGYVSYTLESLPGYKEGKLKGLNIRYNSIYGGETVQKVTLRNETASPAPATDASAGTLYTKTK